MLCLLLIHGAINMNICYLYHNGRDLFPSTMYHRQHCKDIITTTTWLFYLGECVTFIVLSIYIQNSFRKHTISKHHENGENESKDENNKSLDLQKTKSLGFLPSDYCMYRVAILITYSAIALHFTYYVYENRIRYAAWRDPVDPRRVERICIFQTSPSVLIAHYLMMAIILHWMWTVTVMQIYAKIKCIREQKADKELLIENLQRVIWFILIKALTFQISSVYLIDDPRGEPLLILCQGLVSISCLYYTIFPASKAGNLWKLIHVPLRYIIPWI